MTNAALAAMDARLMAALAGVGFAEANGVYAPPGGILPLTPNCTVVIDRQVAVIGDIGEVIGYRVGATFQRAEVSPKVNGTLVIGSEAWTLERKISEDESLSEWVLNDFIGDLLMSLIAPIPLVPTEGGTVNAMPAADITVFQISPATSINAATLTADNGTRPGQFMILSFTGMYASGHIISAFTIAGSNFSTEISLISSGFGSQPPNFFYLFVWNGAKWVYLLTQ